MAQLQIQEQVMVPGVVGILSGSGQLLQDNIKATQTAPNLILRNAGAVTDYGVGAYALVNHMGDFGFPRRGSSELAASGVTVAARRLTQQIGDVILGLKRSVVKGEAGARYRASNGRTRAAVPSEVLDMGFPVGDERIIVNRT